MFKIRTFNTQPRKSILQRDGGYTYIYFYQLLLHYKFIIYISILHAIKIIVIELIHLYLFNFWRIFHIWKFPQNDPSFAIINFNTFQFTTVFLIYWKLNTEIIIKPCIQNRCATFFYYVYTINRKTKNKKNNKSKNSK